MVFVQRLDLFRRISMTAGLLTHTDDHFNQNFKLPIAGGGALQIPPVKTDIIQVYICKNSQISEDISLSYVSLVEERTKDYTENKYSTILIGIVYISKGQSYRSRFWV